MKHYFISDAHLGSALIEDPKAHEDRFISWLKHVAADASAIYLLGDIFDFWFEFPHKKVQIEHQKVLDTLRILSHSGIDIHFFCGNHDQWTFGFLEEHCNIKVHHRHEIISIGNKQFFLAHGHGLGEKRRKVLLLNALFENKTARFIFRHIMPASWAWKLGKLWSMQSRKKHISPSGITKDTRFWDEDKEMQITFSKQHSELHPNINYYVMGHRHLDINLRLKTGAQILIIGDFYKLFTYAIFDGENISIEDYHSV